MSLLFVEYPRLVASISVPDRIAPLVRQHFVHPLASPAPTAVDCAYILLPRGSAWELVRNGERRGEFPTAIGVLFALEEDLENTVIARLGDWVGLHAGAAALHGQAIVIAGHPDTGKTTTTFQLVELGLDFVSEEVTPVDADSLLVHPFFHVPTLSRPYAEASAAQFPVTAGTLTYPDARIARYAPGRVQREPVAIATILLPRFDPSCEPRLEAVTPGGVLAEILEVLFPADLGG